MRRLNVPSLGENANLCSTVFNHLKLKYIELVMIKNDAIKFTMWEMCTFKTTYLALIKGK